MEVQNQRQVKLWIILVINGDKAGKHAFTKGVVMGLTDKLKI